MVILVILIVMLCIYGIIYFITNNIFKVSKEYDKLLNDLMDKETPIEVSYLTMKFKDKNFKIWIGNYPYAYGSEYPSATVYPSMKTRKRLALYILENR